MSMDDGGLAIVNLLRSCGIGKLIATDTDARDGRKDVEKMLEGGARFRGRDVQSQELRVETRLPRC